MSKDIFFYKRKIEGENDKKEKVVVEVYDCFNINCVVRGFWTGANAFILLMNDGHEQAVDVPQEIVKNGKVVGTETKRIRDWFYSQIELTKEDADRYRRETDISIGIKLQDWNKMGEALAPKVPPIPSILDSSKLPNVTDYPSSLHKVD